jgi:photosystem II stability/assembly factor-like uncharacterized protein
MKAPKEVSMKTKHRIRSDVFLVLSMCLLIIACIGCTQGETIDPIANAGPDQTVAARSWVTVDGSESYSPGDSWVAAYRWGFISKPPGSQAEMIYNTSNPVGRFKPDSLGLYRVQIRVDNNQDRTDYDEADITAIEMGVPYADAGADQMVDVGVQGTFDGSGSHDPNQEPLTYEWTTPWPQNLVITNADQVDAAFVLADPGVVEAELTVSDGTYDASDVVLISSNPPTITNVDPLAGGVGTVITIDGSNFHPLAARNRVTVGDATCTVLTASASQITAEIPSGPYPDPSMVIKVKTNVSHGPDTAIGPSFTVATWIMQMNPATSILYDVHFLNDNFGMVAGVEGVFVTNNGGAHWNYRNPGVGKELRKIYIIDASTATAVGADGTIIRSTDGGDTWTQQTSNTVEDLFAVDFLDVDHGIVAGSDATIAMTSDGGNTWTVTWRVNGLRTQIRDIKMMDANTIWAVGNSTIFKTTDGGTIWETQGTINPEIGTGMCFTDALNCWMVGDSGSIIHTGTGGLIWEDQSIATLDQLYDVSFFDNNHGVVVGTAGRSVHDRARNRICGRPQRFDPQEGGRAIDREKLFVSLL